MTTPMATLVYIGDELNRASKFVSIGIFGTYFKRTANIKHSSG